MNSIAHTIGSYDRSSIYRSTRTRMFFSLCHVAVFDSIQSLDVVLLHQRRSLCFFSSVWPKVMASDSCHGLYLRHYRSLRWQTKSSLDFSTRRVAKLFKVIQSDSAFQRSLHAGSPELKIRRRPCMICTHSQLRLEERWDAELLTNTRREDSRLCRPTQSQRRAKQEAAPHRH